MAQILRTHSSGEQDIEKMVLNAVNNATQLIYIENQYFRFPPLADKIKAAAAKQIVDGRDPGKHGPVHLFVITNASDEGIGPGTVNTYRMLDALGRADTIQGVAQLEREEARQAALARQYKKACQQESQAITGLSFALQFNKYDGLSADIEEAKGRLQKAQAKRVKLSKEIKTKPEKNIVPTEIPGLKVHICTLVAPDSPPDNWQYVYIHSKLMIVDDVFMTLGSANLNTRSMTVDSELNICHARASVTHPLRTRLWNMHTAGKGAQDKVAVAFKAWWEIIKENKRRMPEKQTPYAPLIQFRRDDPKRTYLD